MSIPSINWQRLNDRIEALAHIAGSQTRIALTDADKVGRDLVVTWMKDLNLDIQIDQIGNILGIHKGQNPDLAPIMTGSHIDTVGRPGKLDGMYGVLAGLEVIETIIDNAIKVDRDMCVTIFTNEEGVRFSPDMLGSLVYAGGLSIDEALAIKGNDGCVLGDELKRIGYFGNGKVDSLVPHAFVELHIEQGPILDSTGKIIGAVKDLQGISWQKVTIEGQANHAGTTPMHLRHDASFAAAMLATKVRDIANTFGGSQVGTVGAIDLQPNLINVIASKATLTIDLRNTNNDLLIEAEQEFAAYCATLEKDEGVRIEREQLVRFDPVNFDEAIVSLIEECAIERGETPIRMTSGAGHDAQMMARICPSAMIFVPSINGISHNPAEATHAQHLEKGANLLAAVLLKLAAAN